VHVWFVPKKKVACLDNSRRF